MTIELQPQTCIRVSFRYQILWSISSVTQKIIWPPEVHIANPYIASKSKVVKTENRCGVCMGVSGSRCGKVWNVCFLFSSYVSNQRTALLIHTHVQMVVILV